MLNQPRKPRPAKPAPLRSGWVKLQVGGAALMLAAGIPALTPGLDPMAYQVAALVLVPVIAGIALLWLAPRAGTLWLGVLGVVLFSLIVTSPAIRQTEPISEFIATWIFVLGATLSAVAAVPAFRSLRT